MIRLSDYFRLFFRIHLKFWYLSAATLVWGLAVFGIILPLLAFGLSYHFSDTATGVILAAIAPFPVTMLLIFPNHTIAREYAITHDVSGGAGKHLVLGQLLTMLPVYVLEASAFLLYFTYR